MDRIKNNPEPEASISSASSEKHFTVDTVQNVVVPVLQEEVVVEKRLITTGTHSGKPYRRGTRVGESHCGWPNPRSL